MWYMCYIWQEQSWELTLEVTTSHTALSQRRDNTLFGGGDLQNDHDDSNHDHFIGHDDYVWENKTPWWRPPCLVRPCSRPCDHLWFESMKQDNGSDTEKVENYQKITPIAMPFFTFLVLRSSSIHMSWEKFFCEKKKRGSNEKSGLISS